MKFHRMCPDPWALSLSLSLPSGLELRMTFQFSFHPRGPFKLDCRVWGQLELGHSILCTAAEICMKWTSPGKLILFDLVLRLGDNMERGGCARSCVALSLIQHVSVSDIWGVWRNQALMLLPFCSCQVNNSFRPLDYEAYSSKNMADFVFWVVCVQMQRDELLHKHRCYRSKYSSH